MLAKFYGEALRCVGDGCDVENVNILGFDTGFEAITAPRLTLRDLHIDANNCYWLHNIGNINKGGDVHCRPELTFGGGNRDEQWTIDSVTATGTFGTGQCRLHVSGGSTDDANWFANGDTIWVSTLAFAQGCNGRWIATNVSHTSGATTGSVDLTSSSYPGPTTTGTTAAGSPVMTGVGSLANVYGQQSTGGNVNPVLVPGQSICASGTAPYCPAPAGIAGGSGRSTAAGANISSSYTGNLTVTSTANWPASGYVQAGSETMSFTLVNATTINITGRGLDGTTAAAHNTPYNLIPAVPTVVTTWTVRHSDASTPETDVVMSAPALSSASGTTIKFLNDNTGAASAAGTVNAYATMRYWSYNQAVGPWSGTNISALPNCTQPVPPSMLDDPLTSPGNCPATGFLFGGHNTDDALGDRTGGITLFNPFVYAHEIAFHIWNADSVGLSMAGTDNHSGLNDPNVIGFWFDGTSNRGRIDIRGSHANSVSVLQSSDTNDCNEVIASQIDLGAANGHQFENDVGCLILTHGNSSNAGVALVAHNSTQTILSANRMPNVTLFWEDDTAFGNILGDNTNQYFGFWCNPRYAAAASGCVQQQMQASGRFTLKNPSGSPAWEYAAANNLVLQPHADQLAAVIHSSVSDVPASINVVTGGVGIGTKGVQLPLSTSATDLVSNRGAGGCIQIVNSTGTSIQVWDHSPETITNGAMPVDGNTGVSLAAWKAATFCPVSGVGWVGN